jgi:hypothetical protein
LSSKLLNLLRFFGIDRAIAYVVLGRSWSVLSGPITLLFIARFLSPHEQGFYYTFGSVLGLQILFELGLSTVLLHFASHEKAKLEWVDRRTLEGDEAAKARVAAMLRKSLLWYGYIAILLIVIILPAGWLFFERSQPAEVEVHWQLPWTWFVLVSAGTLFITPIFAVLEGCGLVAEMALMRACLGVASSLLLWLTLSQGWGLFAAPVMNTANLLWGLGWLMLRHKDAMVDLLRFRSGAGAIDWRREIWQFQWKIAVSSLSGYFIYQLFNPVLFAFHGPVVAGQMGMSMSVTLAIWTVAAAWIGTKASPFGVLISKGEFGKLDQLFFTSLWQSTFAAVAGGGAFWAAAFYLHSIDHSLSLRLLDPLPLGLLLATNVLNLVVYAEAVYLRSHKQEPFLMLSLANGCLVGLSTYFLGRFSGVTEVMAGYFAINLVVSLGVGTWIFMQKRRLWHGEAMPHPGGGLMNHMSPESLRSS